MRGVPAQTSNEQLAYAFGLFGSVDRAVVAANHRRTGVGLGIVEFAERKDAERCLRERERAAFCLQRGAPPCFVEPLELLDFEINLY